MCAAKARIVLGSVVVPADLAEWQRGCASSCNNVPGAGRSTHEHVQWRQQQRGDQIVVGGGGDGAGAGNLDDLPLPSGEGWRCNETERWKPCLDTCDVFESEEERKEKKEEQTGHAVEAAESKAPKKAKNGLQRSGCIYGCREALLRGIPAVGDCPQWCDETVDQVMLLPDRYGKSVFQAPLPVDAEDAKKTWAVSCNDACAAGFDLRKNIKPCTP